MDEGARQCGLVRKCLCADLSQSILWIDDRTRNRVQSDTELQGLTPDGIIDLLVSWVRDENGDIFHKREDRQGWKDKRDYYFWVLIPVSGLPRELFVELSLNEPCDEDFPDLTVLHSHLTRFGPNQ